MANNVKGVPWVITSAASVTTDDVFIVRMTWQEPTAADDLTILDKTGNTLWDENAIAGGSGISIEKEMGCFVNGFNVSVIDGGTLYVYHK